MRITFVTPTLNYNGGLRVIAIYADWLSRLGHQVTVISPGKPKPSLYQQVKCFLKGETWDGAKNFSAVYFESLDFDLIILESNRAVEETDIPDADIIIATWWETSFWVNNLSTKKGKKVYFMQDYGNVPGQPIDKIQETWMLPFHIITISEWLANLVKEYRDIDDGVSLVPNGVDFSIFDSPHRNKNATPTIGFLYTDAPQKGADTMIQAYLKAKESISNLRLIMFGSKEIPDELKDREDIIYYQKPSDNELSTIYSACDAWLFGSYREGFGLPILESMACRTPVIATTAGAAPQLVNSKNGIIVNTGDIKEMANAIIAIGTMENDSWKDLSNSSYEVAQQHTWDAAANTFENILLDLQ